MKREDLLPVCFKNTHRSSHQQPNLRLAILSFSKERLYPFICSIFDMAGTAESNPCFRPYLEGGAIINQVHPLIQILNRVIRAGPDAGLYLNQALLNSCYVPWVCAAIADLLIQHHQAMCTPKRTTKVKCIGKCGACQEKMLMMQAIE